MMKRIGILGGTFDPVHIGHLKLAEAAMEQLELDEVIFMVTGTPHYKVGQRKVSSKEDRLKMTELAAATHPGFSVSDRECRREGDTYTADTLEELKKECPEDEFYLITGADAFFHMVHWYRIESVLRNAAVAVVLRGTETDLERVHETEKVLVDKYSAKVVSFNMTPMDVSSTMIREWIRNGEDAGDLLTENVKAYIRMRNLYREV